MDNYNKLIIYYEPLEGSREFLKSFTLSFSRISKTDNTYKQKAILEHKSKIRNCIEEYKMKEFHIGAKDLLKKIKNIDFDKKYTKPTKQTEYFCISYGDKKIITGDRSEIEEILNNFNFIRLSSITHKHYEFIKDMNEYTNLLDILNSKISILNRSQLFTLSKMFKQINPYILFQSMSWLPKFLDDNKKYYE